MRRPTLQAVSSAPEAAATGTDGINASLHAGPSGSAVASTPLAEDDDVNAMIAVAYLERSGVVVERVAIGAESVVAVLRRVDRPDLVLMDCRMPVMDGYAAARVMSPWLATGAAPPLSLETNPP